MIRKTVHAGTFYPRFGEQIRTQIESWIAEASPAPESERCLGLLLPHAGYVYSGRCACLGLASIAKESLDAVIVLHPSHQSNHFDFSVSPFGEYETPLGNLQLDTDIYAQISPQASQDINLDYHRLEHSLEIQLPLLRYFFPEVKICPVMIGNQIPAVAQRLAEIMYSVVYRSSRRILILISSDLSHYHDAQTAQDMDGRLAKHFMNMDASGMWNANQRGKLEACGIGGILTLLMLAEHYIAIEPRIIHYTHSGKVSGMNSQVVGYLAAKIVH
ncbi:MAG: AmmeMemoRadiSam system protein B [Candidatus Cloacimonadaceae bacterium]|jgi:AmmeMemoRadiSam system protein B|nr:AmmeMemoRadiSam system protein B [Candidatus Cloacimonadota bacterium]MDY0127921.1 AmmeMemoRadiSam system protein B [Candidatus Cloacimonadaceae bacterium]MCB5255288.1 AmmeMemoRadiSam system protein B [Candidatus Cloacimonadota bacterium]MCK9177998.1 AmmeMemoRadiSam system protein B [Candidatus Cloacimonadota bacterium]MCK9242938.1 AmmeMemoRadiSam system protein B [Candidatus Cloacimonadota bacterium]